MSDSLRPHELQHTRLPCPSPIPEAYSDSCHLNRWCHPTISSSVVPFSSHLQSFPASGTFQMSQFFALGGLSIGVSASESVLPTNIQNWFPLRWTSWISLQPKELHEEYEKVLISYIFYIYYYLFLKNKCLFLKLINWAQQLMKSSKNYIKFVDLLNAMSDTYWVLMNIF